MTPIHTHTHLHNLSLDLAVPLMIPRGEQDRTAGWACEAWCELATAGRAPCGSEHTSYSAITLSLTNG